MVSERILRKSFQKVKKQISQLKNQDKKIKEDLQRIEKSIPRHDQIENAFRKALEAESAKFVHLEQLDSLIAKNPDVIYMLQHFQDLDEISITKKQFKHFTKKVEQLRRDAAELQSIKRGLKRNLALDTSVRKLNREVKKLKVKNG